MFINTRHYNLYDREWLRIVNRWISCEFQVNKTIRLLTWKFSPNFMTLEMKYAFSIMLFMGNCTIIVINKAWKYIKTERLIGNCFFVFALNSQFTSGSACWPQTFQLSGSCLVMSSRRSCRHCCQCWPSL